MGDAGQLTFASARSLSLDGLTDAFNRGFEGYPVPIGQTPDSLLRMLRENDVREEESLVALAPGGAPVGVALLGRRGARAWVAGMGVAPEWRGQGQGEALLRRLLAQASELGAQLVTLEVLDENTTAQRLYVRLGFHETRQLTIYTGEARVTPAVAWQTFMAASGAGGAETHAQRRALPQHPAPKRLTVGQALRQFDALHGFALPWQRERATLAHMATRLAGLALGAPAQTTPAANPPNAPAVANLPTGSSSSVPPTTTTPGLRAYILISRQPRGFTIMDVGSTGASSADRLRDTLTLLHPLLAERGDTLLRAINVPPGDPLGDALDALGCPIVARQREMALALHSLS